MVGRPKGTPKTGGRQKGAPNKPTFDTRSVSSPDGLTPLGYMIGVLNSKNASDKDRKWAARAAAPYVHPRIRPALSAVAAGAGKVTVEIRRFTDDRSLLQIDKDGTAPAQPVEDAIDRLEAEWFKPDSQHVAHEPALPPQIRPAPPPPQPPALALVAAPVPHENRPVHRAKGNGANTTQPQRVNGHPRRVNGTVVRRSDEEIRNISDRRPMPSGYPRTRPVHGVV